MNISGLKKSFMFFYRNQITPFLHGSQGIGKTQVIEQACKENGLECIVLHLATQDVGDLVGLLVKNSDGTVNHAKPKWFPTEGQGIVFCDEANRAPSDVIQAMYSFMTPKRSIHTHVLPPGWSVMCAGNYQSDRFQVTDTSDAAWMSRFCHIDFVPSVEEFLVYAENKGADTVADFIREQPSLLEMSAKDAGRFDDSFIQPDRRAWLDGVFKLEAEPDLPDELRYELYSGFVGKPAAAAFITHKQKTEKSLSLGQILKSYNTHQKRVRSLSSAEKEYRFDVLNQPIDELLVRIETMPDLLTTDKALENLKSYLLDIPRELSMKCFSKLATLQKFYGREEILNDPKYVKMFT